MFLIPESSWEIKEVEGMGRGVFAKQDIQPGTIIGDYIGKMLKPEDEEHVDNAGHFYLMYYHDRASIYPDLKKPGIYLFNHSCAPNCWMYVYKGHILFFALRHIFKGEQLTVSYLLSPLDKTCAPCTHLCKCDSPLCFQTMHMSEKRYDEWSEFEGSGRYKDTKRERVTYGKDLPLLKEYPKSIPDNGLYVLFGADKHLPIKHPAKTLPTKHEIRKIIRETGRKIQFSKLNLQVQGVYEDLIISKSTA